MTTLKLVAILFEFFALLTGTFYLKQIRARFLYLYAFVILGLITEMSMPIMSKVYGVENSHWLSHFYFPLEFLLLALVYLQELRPLNKKKWINVIVAIIMLFSIVNPIFIQEFTKYSEVRGFTSIVLVMFSILYYYQVMADAKITKLANEPMIWINTAVLLYFASGLFYNMLFTYILEYSKDFANLSVTYNTAFGVSFYSLITIGFWKAAKQQKAIAGG
ncbi:hypothetical protein [Maribellus sediminis]|uniref:hypothetical protein n=1 Tax=Maribellus sediminis TaxID=2696285 RepID=UPI00142F99CA|nr:hypothetical protein [Maribellus sediminis]